HASFVCGSKPSEPRKLEMSAPSVKAGDRGYANPLEAAAQQVRILFDLWEEAVRAAGRRRGRADPSACGPPTRTPGATPLPTPSGRHPFPTRGEGSYFGQPPEREAGTGDRASSASAGKSSG